MKFKVGDKVRFGTAVGEVTQVYQDAESAVRVRFRTSKCFIDWGFTIEGGLWTDVPGQPLLELIERPTKKKKKKVTVWQWEGPPEFYLDTGWNASRTSRWSEHPPGDGWTKVPGSERVIEVEENEGEQK